MLPTPTLPAQRAEVLDMLRGFALLGIIIANYQVISSYVFMPPQAKAALPYQEAAHYINYFDTLFIEGKFYSLFSLLFGVGFYLFMKPGTSGAKSLGLFYRRLVILIFIGMLHLLLCWEGDILMLYGVMGLLLPLFRNASDRTLLVWWILLILSPVLLDALRMVTPGAYLPERYFEQWGSVVSDRYGITDQNYYSWLATHDAYADTLRYNHSACYFRWAYLIAGNRPVKVLGMFVLGLYVGRKMIHAQLEERRGWLKRVRNWGWAIGLPASIGLLLAREYNLRLPAPEGLLKTLAYALSVVPLCLAYTAGLCLLFLNPKGRKWLSVFTAPGKMALTNYIAQTLVGMFLFYGIGLGWGTKTSLAGSTLIAVCVYMILAFLSHWWLRFFRFGPLEWIWRMLTYGSWLQIRKSIPT